MSFIYHNINIMKKKKVFLHMVMANKKKIQLKYRDLEWWMKRRQLPSHLRKRVRHFQCQSWVTMGGQDEMELIQHFPDGLRRDIRRYLCLDLVKKVPIYIYTHIYEICKERKLHIHQLYIFMR